MAKKPEYNYKSLQTEYGKMPPQAVDLEEAILGSLMLEKDAFITVSDFLKPECFYKEAHQKIYRGIQNLSCGYSYRERGDETFRGTGRDWGILLSGSTDFEGGIRSSYRVPRPYRGAEIYSAGIDPGMYRHTE